jgi:type II secretory ATPase GspE/PulE/Tfp pilus assembly ATPase PilB-like protein
MGIEAFLISSSLEGVLAQRLVRRICADCKCEQPPDAAARDKLQSTFGTKLDGKYHHGSGCDECRGTGYRGRVGIFELLAIDAELREMIVQKRSNSELKAHARSRMITMHQDAMRKAAAGMTTLEEIIRVTSAEALE